MQHLEVALLRRIELARGPVSVPGLGKPKAKTGAKPAAKSKPKSKPAPFGKPKPKPGMATPKTTLKTKPRKGTDEWWKGQSKTFQKKYLKEHPSSKFNPANRSKRKDDKKPKSKVPGVAPKKDTKPKPKKEKVNVLKRKKDQEKLALRKKKELEGKKNKLKKAKSDRLLKKKKDALERHIKLKKNKINHALDTKKKKMLQALEHKKAKAKQEMEDRHHKEMQRKEAEAKKRKIMAIKDKKKREAALKKLKLRKDAKAKADKAKKDAIKKEHDALVNLLRGESRTQTERERRERDIEGVEDEDLPQEKQKKMDKVADWFEGAVKTMGRKAAEGIVQRVTQTFHLPDMSDKIPSLGKPSFVIKHDNIVKQLKEIDKDIRALKEKRDSAIQKMRDSKSVEAAKKLKPVIKQLTAEIKKTLQEKNDLRAKQLALSEKADSWYAANKASRGGSKRSTTQKVNKNTGAGKVSKIPGRKPRHLPGAPKRKVNKSTGAGKPPKRKK